MTMQTRWRAPLTSAIMTDRPGRTGQGSQKARLGLAAEHPVRAGLPRRNITEHHTEVQLLNFDPRTLGVYIPPDHHLIRDIPMDMIQAIEAGSIHAIDNAIDSDLVSEDQCDWIIEEREKLELEILSGASFHNPEKLEWAWRSLWKKLIDGDCHAISVDERCRIHEIDAYFWTTSFAIDVFFSGQIIENPPYRPHGRVMISDAELKKLQKHYYRKGYRCVLPSSIGIKPDEEDLSDLYASSLMGETEAIKRGRPGARPQIDKEAYLIEVFALVYEEKVFKSKSDLARLAADRFVTNNPGTQRPSREWTVRVTTKVWERLGLKDTPVSELRRIRGAEV